MEVFSKAKAIGLPSNRSHDCSVELLPGTTALHGWIYPLSISEQQAMEDTVSEAVKQRYIEHSTSPAAATFFFVEKKGGGLHPRIDYCGLNQIKVKYPYPLLLIGMDIH